MNEWTRPVDRFLFGDHVMTRQTFDALLKSAEAEIGSHASVRAEMTFICPTCQGDQFVPSYNFKSCRLTLECPRCRHGGVLQVLVGDGPDPEKVPT